ncbi:MAG: galactose mutarotase [Gemmatimonadetes bacterium]|nr:galactose mutarotase [Gemmatimonadota bacterium]
MSKTLAGHAALPLVALALLAAWSCAPKEAAMSRSVTQAPFGTTPDSQAVEIYTLTNPHGIQVRAMTYGGVIVSLKTPDRTGELGDIVLGYDDLAHYVADSPYFGAIIGRYANRIAKGRFTLDGKTYQLPVNDGPNSLHGGTKGFDKRVWDAHSVQTDSTVGVVFHRVSPDGEEGYPGTLDVTVTYTLKDDDELVIDYRATTDEDTPVNLTQHSYFNLDGAGNGDVLGQELMVNADSYTPIDSTFIPTGQIAPVAGTPFDFRTLTAIGARIDDDNQQLKWAGGYDHNFVLNRPDSLPADALVHAVHAVDPKSGRTLDVYTTEPGIQIYTGNFLDGTITGKDGKVYVHRGAFTVETQHYPDSPNEPSFPSTILHPGQTYQSRTVWKFGVQG